MEVIYRTTIIAKTKTGSSIVQEMFTKDNFICANKMGGYVAGAMEKALKNKFSFSKEELSIIDILKGEKESLYLVFLQGKYLETIQIKITENCIINKKFFLKKYSEKDIYETGDYE